jgi:hypothetical protein
MCQLTLSKTLAVMKVRLSKGAIKMQRHLIPIIQMNPFQKKKKNQNVIKTFFLVTDKEVK